MHVVKGEALQSNKVTIHLQENFLHFILFVLKKMHVVKGKALQSDKVTIHLQENFLHFILFVLRNDCSQIK